MARCGRCKGNHATAAEVRACYNSPLPARTPVPAGTVQQPPSTNAQHNFVRTLLDRLGRDESTLDKRVEDYSKIDISAVIDRLQDDVRTAPRQERLLTTPIQGGELDDGMYRMAGSIYKVQHAVHGSGRQYAKILRIVAEPERDDEGDIVSPGSIVFSYAPGVVHQLTSEHRMTLEQAKEFGALYGTCVRCGRTLTKEKSIERAMGPVCAQKI